MIPSAQSIQPLSPKSRPVITGLSSWSPTNSILRVPSSTLSCSFTGYSVLLADYRFLLPSGFSIWSWNRQQLASEEFLIVAQLGTTQQTMFALSESAPEKLLFVSPYKAQSCSGDCRIQIWSNRVVGSVTVPEILIKLSLLGGVTYDPSESKTSFLDYNDFVFGTDT